MRDRKRGREKEEKKIEEKEEEGGGERRVEQNLTELSSNVMKNLFTII